eukprot:CAMPEP_0198516662 /NCGR_PEP_ID=MMETSP1462-20131121/18055_1 /TAXON_ID=1333877 /ORGANISM="Brandtodinium nutriculum, Strain RCC3387" /LENGTH=34 /DNA_ID= /DNA_START= /DNA_END= /DNA_ORIENTATION=
MPSPRMASSILTRSCSAVTFCHLIGPDTTTPPQG